MARENWGPNCFGPDEIRAMQRALELAEGALRHGRGIQSRNIAEQRQRLARTIIDRARTGLMDPIMLSAAAVGAIAPAAEGPGFGAYRPRGQRMRRALRRSNLHSHF